MPPPDPWPRPVTPGCGAEPLTVASSGIRLCGPEPLPPAMSLPPGDTRDSLDGLVPVTPQRLPDGLHVHPELGEADLLEEGTVVGVPAGGGREEVVHCNDSAWGRSPSGLAPARPAPRSRPTQPAGRGPRAEPPGRCPGPVSRLGEDHTPPAPFAGGDRPLQQARAAWWHRAQGWIGMRCLSLTRPDAFPPPPLRRGNRGRGNDSLGPRPGSSPRCHRAPAPGEERESPPWGQQDRAPGARLTTPGSPRLTSLVLDTCQ